MDATAAATLFAWLDREVWLLTARANGRARGLVATQVGPVSTVAEVPRVLVGVAKHHPTRELVEASRAFAVHLLSKDNTDLVWRFALPSDPDADPFAGLTTMAATTGSPILGGTVGWLDCRVETSLDAGDRTLYVAEVVDGQVTHFAAPLMAQHLMEHAPPHLLTQLQRRRHLDSHSEAAALQVWREERRAGE